MNETIELKYHFEEEIANILTSKGINPLFFFAAA